jgi:hypothetical protein
MSIVDVTCDVKRRRESGEHHPHDEEASEVYFVEIFGVEKQVWNTKIFAEAASDHSKEYDPAEQQYLVAFQVI